MKKRCISQRFFCCGGSGDCRSPALPRASLQKKRKLVSLRFLFFVFLQLLLNASIQGFVGKQKERSQNFALFCGERGIRTPGTGNPVRQFSKLVVSATHPPLRAKFGAFPISGNAGAKIYIICIYAKIIYENIFHHILLVVFFKNLIR